MGNTVLTVSVRKLVEFATMSGSIDSRFVGSNIMQEGTKTHQRLQNSRGEDYQKEVHLAMDMPVGAYVLHIEGRCDGIYSREKQTIIEEIKTTSRELSTLTEKDFPSYWAQAKMYGYIYGKQQKLDLIDIHLLFAKRDSLEERTFIQSFTLEELESFVETTLAEYMNFMHLIMENKYNRNQSIKELSFPFPVYRKGQKDLAKAVYKTIKEKKRLFASASTGIGKTISTIFPALLSIEDGKAEKIMYLTAKTVTRTVAEDAFRLLMNQGLSFKVVTITAKEKICFQDETRCQREFCSYADGYYDRLKEGLREIISNEQLIDRGVIEAYAHKHHLCPFEFSLDIAMYADAVICDYNYYFNPKVKLQRWGEFHKESIVLIDEAHNLVDRSREMFSAEISKSLYLHASRILKSGDNVLYLRLKAVNDIMLVWKKELIAQDTFVIDEKPSHLIPSLTEAVEECERWLKVNSSGTGYEEVLSCYFEMQSFIRVMKDYNDSFKTIVTIYKSEVMVKLLCLDPSSLLRAITKKSYAIIFFSATLQPIGYYQTLLGGEKDDYHIKIETPFEQEQLKVFASSISTKYKDREASIPSIVKTIISTFHSRKGNYLVFFPSFEYMLQVYESYKAIVHQENVHTIVQEPIMTEDERDRFLRFFYPRSEDTLIGFAVLGGIFSEGIDLKGDRLNGVGIIGVGLPKINLERNVMKDYFQEKGYNGFDFAYVYPGINKVQQAGGRLIRSEEDTGFILLIDDRYFSSKYNSLLPMEWKPVQPVTFK
ncbi:ATP-dependent DNA helicase [Sutcliffiella deserti]|uniref:ATP-dependent DNA helicase n=1 Tax=Sutcliffiella deserti TaxID=2875501 RepID=UPI001CBF217B|nr:ATP-dependent DNA helicase [Sutcliffiella deserti]